MKLSIHPIGQREADWKLKRLGNSTTTIGNYGCLLVCHTMMLNYFGKDVDPITLNEIYKSKNVFHDGNLIGYGQAADCWDDVTADDYELFKYVNNPCDMDLVDKYLIEKRLPVIAWVDNIHDDGKPDHFVLIIGKDENGKYLINDPWLGETQYFHNLYGDDPSRFIYGLRLYTGTPKDGESVEDKYKDSMDKLATCNTSLAEKALEVNTLRGELEAQEKENDEFAKQLNQARGERDKEAWAKEQGLVKIKGLEEDVVGLEKQLLQKADKIVELKNEIQTYKDNVIPDLGFWGYLLKAFKSLRRK